jgi:hypothetical protein
MGEMDVLTWESLKLLSQHEERLRDGSAISLEVPLKRGHRMSTSTPRSRSRGNEAIMTARKHLATSDQLLARHGVGRGSDVAPAPLLAARSSAFSATRSGGRSDGLRPQRLGRPLDLEVLLFGRSFGEVVREFVR